MAETKQYDIKNFKQICLIRQHDTLFLVAIHPFMPDRTF